MKIQQLHKQLKCLTHGSNSIDTYMRKARSICNQLNALESFILEEALVCDVLEGLGVEYRPFTRAIEARNTPIGFNELYALLLSEESQLQFDSLSISSAVPPTAQYVNAGCGGNSGRSRGGRGNRGRGNYFQNSRRGHGAGHGENNSVSSQNLVCYNCNGNNHVARQCPFSKSYLQAHTTKALSLIHI